MLVYYCYIICIFLSPLPVSWVLYKYFQASHDKLQVNIFKKVILTFGGVAVSYTLILLLNIILLCPYFFGLELNNDFNLWHYTLDSKKLTMRQSQTGRIVIDNEEKLKPIQGTLRINYGPGDIIHIEDLSDQKLDTINVTKQGLADDENIFIPLSSSLFTDSNHKQPVIVAYGAFQKFQMTLPIYTLKERNSVSNEYIKGTLILSRDIPVLPLLFITLFPIIIVVCLKYIAPIVSVTELAFLRPGNGAGSNLEGGISFKIAHATSMYLFIYFILFTVIDHGFIKYLYSSNDESYVLCKKIEGEWRHALYRNMPNSAQSVLTYVGRFDVECHEDMTKMRLGGFNNPIHAGLNPTDIYDFPFLQGESWGIDLIGLFGNMLIGVYQVGVVKPDIGVVTAIIYPYGKLQTAQFHEFRDYTQYPEQKSSGEIYFYHSQLSDALKARLKLDSDYLRTSLK